MVYQKDVFLCHASEDKSAVIRPLAIALDAVGISYWLDEAEIHWGDSITGKVNEGLRQSRFVVVVMSEAFVAKHWPQREFNAVLNEEASTGEVCVLPLIVGSRTERRHIMSEYPLLNDKLYLEWDGGADKVVQALKGKLGMPESVPNDATAPKIRGSVGDTSPFPMPHMRRQHTQRDKDVFLRSTYSTISQYFQNALAHLQQQVAGVEIEFDPSPPVNSWARSITMEYPRSNLRYGSGDS